MTLDCRSLGALYHTQCSDDAFGFALTARQNLAVFARIEARAGGCGHRCWCDDLHIGAGIFGFRLPALRQSNLSRFGGAVAAEKLMTRTGVIKKHRSAGIAQQRCYIWDQHACGGDVELNRFLPVTRCNEICR